VDHQPLHCALLWAEPEDSVTVNRLARQGPNLLVDGSPIATVWDKPIPGRPRPWFECPLCKRRSRHVYLHRMIACRICSGPLDYTSPISMPITAIAQSDF
jgi:hypothetical protein